MPPLPQDVVADLRRRVAELEQRLQSGLAERDEAIAQQAATSEVLQGINASPGDLAPVFDEILRSIAHLFGSEERFIFLVGEDGLLHIGAAHGSTAERARA